MFCCLVNISGLNRKLFSLLLWLSIFILLVGVSLLVSYARNDGGEGGHKNYFILGNNKGGRVQYAVETSTCKMIEADPWDSSITRFLKPEKIPPNCYEKNGMHWTYVKGKELRVNKSAMLEYGFSLQSAHCCYQEISRIEQSLDSYDEYADTEVSVSECVEVKGEVTLLEAEFIQVKCISKRWPLLGDVLYRNFHALVQPLRSEGTKRKIKGWALKKKEKKELLLPPSVFVVGIDSMSRSNFMRTMPRTKKYLTEIGAKELVGYTKVGENTFPNMVPVLTGYDEDEYKEICYPTLLTAQDDCPFLWKAFDEAGYLTAHLEDVPALGAFNYEKTGFVKQPVDFYLRTLMLKIYGKELLNIYYKDCIGYHTVDETILNYIEELHNVSRSLSTPSFIFSWLTNVGHGDMNVPRYSDRIYESFLRRLDLRNTILFFMSDHGHRFGAFRETFMGWYEDKLPNFWVYLPPTVRSKYPSWVSNLEINAKRLSSPYDLYHTMRHILEEFSQTPPIPDNTSLKNRTVVVRRKFGQSLFHQIPESRDCPGAGIGTHYCACETPIGLDTSRGDVKNAVKSSIVFINKKLLPPQCGQFSLSVITAAASTVGDDELEQRSSSKSSRKYIVTFSVLPGDFLFEATVEHSSRDGGYLVLGKILRMNKINTYVGCVRDPELQRLCYCT